MKRQKEPTTGREQATDGRPACLFFHSSSAFLAKTREATKKQSFPLNQTRYDKINQHLSPDRPCSFLDLFFFLSLFSYNEGHPVSHRFLKTPLILFQIQRQRFQTRWKKTNQLVQLECNEELTYGDSKGSRDGNLNKTVENPVSLALLFHPRRFTKERRRLLRQGRDSSISF